MRIRYYLLVPCLALLLATNGAPAGNELSTEQANDTIILIVDNDFGSTVNVFAVWGAAAARRLGSVGVGAEEMFTVRWSSGGFATQIESVMNNRRVVSNTLDVPPGAIVYVELDSNFRTNARAWAIEND